MKTLALVMIVKNEEKHLARCLQSVQQIVDDIVIVDTGSIDATKDIAYSFGAKVFDFEWVNDFSAARNYALMQSTCDWNLVLDADEYIVNDCKSTIRHFIETNKQQIGRIRMVNEFIQNGEKRYAQSYLSRLLPKGVTYVGKVHEQVNSPFPRQNIDVEVYHDGYVHTNKTERNLQLLLEELKQHPNDDYVLYQVGKQYKLLQQFNMAEKYFEESYHLASLHAWYRHSLVIDYLYTIIATRSFEKGLQLIAMEQERLNDSPDFHFACGLFYMDAIFCHMDRYAHLFPFIEQCFTRCLEIGETKKYDRVRGTGSFLAAYNLGVFYEVTGQVEKAVYFYKQAVYEGYEKAIERLSTLKS
ncbi:glycosyltransferase involved in cell wall biosynthesis [Anoxybacillus tengchongensis]|uniref:Glycosyltransferase involved in cell wall biosynthesis n=1 Tax=Anoxybacillus tengchongensis TaxID=576944 RepID=A0A7X0DAE0_9BACL|nr:glycosyltransferase family 2 protein [Anoxybacillus tengchongensis]MBB6177632.1 glycosyltransferase involved in cell wall biosynthesis [Anoxybacillus tengchongensis]